MEVIKALESSSNAELKGKVAASLRVILSALDMFREDEMAFSFNGGKDSTVLLHLLRMAFAHRYLHIPLLGLSPPAAGRGSWSNGAAAAEAGGAAAAAEETKVAGVAQGREQGRAEGGESHGGEASSLLSNGSHVAGEAEACGEGRGGQQTAGVGSSLVDAAAAVTDGDDGGDGGDGDHGVGGGAEAARRPCPPRIFTIYFQEPNGFREIDEFTQQTAAKYDLDMKVLRGDFKGGLQQLQEERPVRAIFLGTRRADPHGSHQSEFSQSSPGWPPFTRVNPILSWTYADVWSFLIAARVTYCSLYDIGYTSIGGTHNTDPNEALRINGQLNGRKFSLEKLSEEVKKSLTDLGINGSILQIDLSFLQHSDYWPAYMLQNGDLERAGRK